MKYSKIIAAFFLLTVVLSCKQKQNNDKQKEIKSTDEKKSNLVDYKSDTYKIAIGESYKISDPAVDWSWAELADSDNKIDSTGKDFFMSISEPLLKYNGSEYLPSLHIETDKNIITSFKCSVLFDLADSSTAMEDFLKTLSSSIKQLQNEQLVKSLTKDGVYEIIKDDCMETFKLSRGEELDYDRFEYTMTPKK